MCVYCMCAEWADKWWPDPGRTAPRPDDWPVIPPAPWRKKQVEEFEEILERIQKLEEQVGGCPCPDEEKTDFLEDIKRRLDRISEDIGDEIGGDAP